MDARRFIGAGLGARDGWKFAPKQDVRPGMMELVVMSVVSMSMPILIVDDYNTMIRIMRNLLRQLGFSNIDEASDGRTALTKMRAKDYGLVISDWNLEPMTGVELVQQVRAAERFKNTPILMISNDNDEVARVAERAGANSYLVKPFNANALKSKLEGVIGKF